MATVKRRSVKVGGKCRRCGRCCRPPLMRHPDFIIDWTDKRGTTIYDGHCRYLTEPLDDGRQLCKICLAVDEGDTSEFPEEHVKYWKRCCRYWPTYRGKVEQSVLIGWAKAGYFDGCGFRVARKKVSTDG